MSKEFAHNAVVTDDFQMTAEERLRYSLAQPEAKNAMTVRAMNAITKARIQYGVAELAQGNIANVQKWLEQVAEVSPKTAIQLYLELLEFSTPRLKAVEVTQNDAGSKPMAQYTVAELQAMAEATVNKVVSHQ